MCIGKQNLMSKVPVVRGCARDERAPKKKTGLCSPVFSTVSAVSSAYWICRRKNFCEAPPMTFVKVYGLIRPYTLFVYGPLTFVDQVRAAWPGPQLNTMLVPSLGLKPRVG